jgi:uncharacterized protein YndB with AHSA1/START domain
MQRIIVDHDFVLPPDRVFAYMGEHENLGPMFGAEISRIRDGTDGNRNGVGSMRKLKVGPFPAFEETVTEVIPNELIRYRITEGSPLRDHEGLLRFTPNPDGGTHLHYEISFRGAIPGLGPLIAPGLRRSITKGLPTVDSKA